jgi:hypothetical protein
MENEFYRKRYFDGMNFIDVFSGFENDGNAVDAVCNAIENNVPILFADRLTAWRVAEAMRIAVEAIGKNCTNCGKENCGQVRCVRVNAVFECMSPKRAEENKERHLHE